MSDSRERGWDAAYLDALQRDLAAHPETGYGNLSGLLLMWITSNWADAESFEAAQALLDRDDDPRRQQVLDVIHGLAAGKVTWSQFAQITKRLIRRERKEPPLPPDDAIPLADALALQTMLAQAGVDAERPDPRKAWSTFSGFAARPVSAAPLSVESDICLFQWGIHDSEEGANVECSFTRQFVLHDADGDYDHMEQLSLSLLFNADDPDLASLVNGADPDPASLQAGQLWSESDLHRWTQDVEDLAVFRAVTAQSPNSLRLEHSDV